MTGRPESGDATGGSDPERLGGVRRVYDHWAGYYDWNPALALVWRARAHAVAAMDLDPGDTVVDMGTGTGANLPHLRRAVGSRGRVIGIDVSPGMLAQARGRIGRQGWDNVGVLRGDVREPPIERPVDGIVSAFLAVMYDDVDRVIDTWADHVDRGAIANLYAGPSDRWYGGVSNGLLGAYLRTFEDGWLSPERDSSALDVIGERGERARSALAARADSVERQSHVFGLAHVDVGHFE